MFARKPRPRRKTSIAALRGDTGPNLEAFTARRRVNEGMAIARLEYDDNDGGVRGSALDQESRGGCGDLNSTSAFCCGACSRLPLHVSG
jgi:hypothetical protein